MIGTIKLSRLSNALHFEFMSEFDTSIVSAGCSPDTLDVQAAYTAFKTALLVEDWAMKNVKASVITKEIANADKLREDYYTGMQYSVWGARYHHDMAIRSAADRINLVLEQYGNPTRLNYKAETGILRSLVADLETKLLPDITKIGAEHWVAPLKQANLEVDMLICKRSDEELAQSQVNMKDARAAVDLLYKALIVRINALAEVKGSGLFTSFINVHNARIGYFKKTIAHLRKTPAKIGQNSKVDDPQ